MRYGVILCICFCVTSSLFAKKIENSIETNNSGVEKLELAGEDSFEYDINNKIRKAKSNVQVGVGINFKVNQEINKLEANASVALGYSYFFHKTFGIRLQGIFDNTRTSYFGGAGFDVMWDFIQTEPFGIGVLIGSSVGFHEQYGAYRYKGFLGQLHVGMGMIFDGGRSRLDGLVRIPYNKTAGDKISKEITYILMYSYTF